MRYELEQKLGKQFSFMRIKKSFQEQIGTGFIDDLYSAFGCECGDGWYEILYQMCVRIQKAYADVGITPDIVMLQIKEKYGTLRVYWSAENGDQRLHKTLDSIIQEAEKASASVCEICGKPGELRCDRSWIQTLCDVCNKK